MPKEERPKSFMPRIQTVGGIIAIGALFLNIPTTSLGPTALDAVKNIQLFWLLLSEVSLLYIAVHLLGTIFDFEEQISKNTKWKTVQTFSVIYFALVGYFMFYLTKYLYAKYRSSFLSIGFFLFCVLMYAMCKFLQINFVSAQLTQFSNIFKKAWFASWFPLLFLCSVTWMYFIFHHPHTPTILVPFVLAIVTLLLFVTTFGYLVLWFAVRSPVMKLVRSNSIATELLLNGDQN